MRKAMFGPVADHRGTDRKRHYAGAEGIGSSGSQCLEFRLSIPHHSLSF